MAGLTRIKSDGISDNCDFDGEGTLVLDSTNNRVGIGTSSPEDKLHISGSNAGGFRFTNSDNSDAITIFMRGGNGIANTTDNAVLSLGQRSDVSLITTGNVGIGTSSPTKTLHIDSGSDQIRLSDGAGGFELRAGNIFKISDDGTERMRIDGSGNVGIGTSAPGYRLDVGNGTSHNALRVNGNANSLINITASTTGNARLEFGDSDDDDAGKLYYSNSDNAFTFATNGGTEDMRLDSSGNVGIGTSSPGANLQIVTSAVDSDVFAIRRQDSTTTNLFRFFQDSNITGGAGGAHLNTTNRDLAITASSAAGAGDGIFLKSTGNVGIGTTSPGKKLTVYGTTTGEEVIEINNTSGSADGATTNAIRVVAGNGSYWANLRYTAYSHVWGFGGNPSISEAARIDSSGRLLVNHTADIAPDGYASKLQLCDNSYQGSSVVLRRDQNNASGPTLVFAKSRSSSKGGNAIVYNDDDCGTIRWYGNDGGDTNNEVARIRAQVDGTPGANDMPGRLVFSTTADGANSSTERMRIDSLGRVGIGTSVPTTDAPCTIYNNTTNRFALNVLNDSATGYGISVGSDSNNIAYFYGNAARTIVCGTISKTSSTTSYNTTSDYRLKENVVDLDNAIDRVKLLQPKRFNFIIDPDKTVDGFLAHEAQTVVPEAVTGEKDGEEMQGIDQSKLVPLLTAALQEAIERIETLEAEVAALKSN